MSTMREGGTPDTGRPAGRVSRTLLWLLGALVAAVGVWWAVLTAHGGHLFMVETPSMARTAPVGTLVVTEKVDPATLHSGDIITFRPPNLNRVYTHRIVEVSAAGFRTKGDLNGAPDGWVVPRDRVIGRAQHLWFGMGYLMRMIPWMALGGFVTAIVARLTRPGARRTSIVISGVSLSVSLGLLLVRPLLGAVSTGFVPVDAHSVKMSAVATGILPIRATSLDGRSVDLVPGQIGWVTTAKADAHGRYQLTPSLHLPWWGWVLMALFCAIPFVVSLFVRPDEDTPADDGADGPTGGGPALPAPGASESGEYLLGSRTAARATSATASVAALLLGAAAVSPTSAALTAKITNSTNTAASRTYFTCLDAMRAYTSAQITHNGRLGGGWTLGNGTGVTGTASQATYYTGAATFTNVTVVSPTAASDVGCRSDYGVRSQGYVRLNGTSSTIDLKSSPTSYTSSSPDAMADSDKITFVVWFRAQSTSKGGVLACLAQSGSTCMDRSLYIGADGKLNFSVGVPGLLTSPYYALQTPASVLDGQWHMAAAQLDTVAGRTLWLDGAVVTSDTRTGGQARTMYVQFGYSAGSLLTGMPDVPSSNYFGGDMAFAAIYGPNSAGTPLKTWDILSMYQAGLP